MCKYDLTFFYLLTFSLTYESALYFRISTLLQDLSRKISISKYPDHFPYYWSYLLVFNANIKIQLTILLNLKKCHKKWFFVGSKVTSDQAENLERGLIRGYLQPNSEVFRAYHYIFILGWIFSCELRSQLLKELNWLKSLGFKNI